MRLQRASSVVLDAAARVLDALLLRAAVVLLLCVVVLDALRVLDVLDVLDSTLLLLLSGASGP